MQALIEQMQALIEWIFRNLNSGDPVSDLYTRIIFVGALLALVLEIFSIIQYCSIGCKETQEGIKYLKRNKSEIKLNLPSDTKIGGWLQRHFLIQNEQLIKDENDPQKFLILSAPSILSQPVPRGPVYFAPTLLTALGVLGTFAGIYLGLQKINLNNISEATNLLEASTQLMEGMKLAFVTSLFGLGTSSFFMLFLEAFELSAEKAADTFKGIRLDFEEELQKFRNEYQESLNNFFTEQNQLLQETLGQQRDGLAQVVDSLKTVFIEDSQHMSEE
ncbi:MotA/TolQ/ExbB proton channel family protein, partial [Planktothrix sp.]